MSLGYLEVLGFAADCFQVLLGVVLVFLLVRYRKSAVKTDGLNLPVTGAGPFRHEFMLQSLKHQSEQSFDCIQKTLQSERSNLMRLYEIGGTHLDLDPDCPTLADDPSEAEAFQIGDCEQAPDEDQSANRYQKVAQLAADGLKAPRIAKQLGIPRGEVELVLKMAAASNSDPQIMEPAPGGLRRSGRIQR